jgi:hypothetical protein
MWLFGIGFGLLGLAFTELGKTTDVWQERFIGFTGELTGVWLMLNGFRGLKRKLK